MAGFLSTLVVSGLLAAAPDVFTFDGPEVTARTTSSTGFFIQGPAPFALQTERGTGSVELTVVDRITVPDATFGDAARLDARFRIGGVEYGVELSAAGFPPAPASGASEAVPRRLQWPVGGGVMLDVDLHGSSGLGFSYAPRVHAGAAVWGVGRVTRNGQLLTDSAIIHVAALTAGARSDDEVHTLLTLARPGDHELYVLAWNLPASAEPRGFIEFSFDDVAIERDGMRLPAVATVPSPVGSDGRVVASDVPVTGAGSLGLSILPTTEAVGGSGAAAAEPIAPFISPGRVAVASGQPAQELPVSAPAVGAPGPADATQVPADSFLNEGRVGIAVDGAGPSGSPGAGLIETPADVPAGQPDPFLGEGRVALSAQVAPSTVGGLSTFGQVPLATSGNFSVLPLGPAVPGPSFGFAVNGSDLDVSRAPPIPGTVPGESPAVPLVSTPQPLNAQAPVPLVANPTPLNVQTPVPLVATPPPLNAQPLAPTPGATAAGAPGTAPGTAAGTATGGSGAAPATPAQ